MRDSPLKALYLWSLFTTMLTGFIFL